MYEVICNLNIFILSYNYIKLKLNIKTIFILLCNFFL